MVVCEAAWACEKKDNCLFHGREHAQMHDCGPSLCLNQPAAYRTKAGRRRKIQCLEPRRAALKAQKRRDALAARGA